MTGEPTGPGPANESDVDPANESDVDPANESDIDPVGRRAVEAMLTAATIQTVDYRGELDSTNSRGLAWLRSDLEVANLPRLVMADRQTAGRGRRGRTWQAGNETLTFTLIAPWNFHDARRSKLLSLAVGIGIAEAIEHVMAPRRVRLKWPNDVYVNGAKLAGILIESIAGLNAAVVGVGVNVGPPPGIGSDPHAPRASSIFEATGQATRRYDWLAPIVERILASMDQLRRDRRAILDGFRIRCALTGHAIRFDSRDGLRVGVCRGVAENGGLQIETADGGIETVQSGEVSTVRQSSA